MKVADYVLNTINKFPYGYVFTYQDFINKVKNKEAIIKALNRMAGSGKISKLTKGKYYKPEKTVFGELPPSQYQVVKDLLEVNGKVVGYLTGYSIYNDLGLTTQVSNTIQIGKNDIRSSFKRERYTITFLRQKNIITKKNIHLLQILDSISTIKKIPDTTIKEASKRFLAILNDLSIDDEKTIVRLSYKYSPVTRALLGAFLDTLSRKDNLESLLKSLNPITVYKLEGVSEILANTQKWNIQ